MQPNSVRHAKRKDEYTGRLVQQQVQQREGNIRDDDNDSEDLAEVGTGLCTAAGGKVMSRRVNDTTPFKNRRRVSKTALMTHESLYRQSIGCISCFTLRLSLGTSS